MTRWPTIAALALSLSAAAVPSHASAQETVLRLAETATVMVAPDELAASMRAEATALTARDAQTRVNEAIRDALAAAKKVDGVIVSTGGYTVWRIGPTPQDRTERWQAGQTLNLTGKEGEPLLKLAGELQQKGLLESNLGWRLSRETERKARKEATRQALAGLRGRADEAAEAIGLRFASFREVRLDSVAPPPMPRRAVAMVSRSSAAAAPPPVAEAEELPVTATAEADVVLKAP